MTTKIKTQKHYPK